MSASQPHSRHRSPTHWRPPSRPSALCVLCAYDGVRLMCLARRLSRGVGGEWTHVRIFLLRIFVLCWHGSEALYACWVQRIAKRKFSSWGFLWGGRLGLVNIFISMPRVWGGVSGSCCCWVLFSERPKTFLHVYRSMHDLFFSTSSECLHRVVTLFCVSCSRHNKCEMCR